MTHISLDGDWQLTYFPEGEFKIKHPSELLEKKAPTIPARVPGNVEIDLEAACEIPDPFMADNIHLLRPFEFYEWWYTREFEMPANVEAASLPLLGGTRGKENRSRESGRDAASTLAKQKHWDLVFAGLDTLATVWINEHEIGHAANMLIEHRFDISKALRPGLNTITVRIGSPLQYARNQHYDASLTGPEYREEMLHVRKAAHMGGWDIMPRAISAGIWRPVWLEQRPANAFEQIYYWTVGADASGATLGVRFQFRTDARDLDGLTVRFHGVCGDHSFKHEWPVEFIAAGCHIPVPGARLWWPKGYGEPNLYTVTAQLCRDSKILAERTDTIGLRTLHVDRTERAGARWMPGPKWGDVCRYDEPPEPDTHFVIYVNGEPIMVKGANWVPLDAFHSRDAQRVDAAVALYDDLGCNMIRCWGGNVYEDHRFFDLCDAHGIMVWQDFSFACGRYPQTEEFLGQVRVEAQAVVEKLRNHPSLALWCGDNEIDAAYLWDGLRPEHNRISRAILPRVVHRCDPRRHFVPSSPYVPPNSHDETPEQHLWGPRGYYKGPFYTHHNAHFIGEIGYHGCPNVASIKKFIPANYLWPWKDNEMWHIHDSYHWQHKAIDRDRIKLMANQIREMFGDVPGTLESFALASQIVQAEAKKFFIESTRLRKWRTSGILWWNVIDGWPQFSDAIVDYYFGKKLAYHYIRRVQQPICAIIGEPGSEKYRPLVLCNDSLKSAEVEYTVRDADTGETLVQGTFTVPANENWQVDRLRAYASDNRVYLLEWKANGRAFGNHYLAGTPPFSLERYQAWLENIARLPTEFDATTVSA